ncbi:MAG: hypothetical protein Q8R47_05565 [Nanoarchaeota archaeon]|nr:hypothetical protein [Nanoarchaeota archaeon]
MAVKAAKAVEKELEQQQQQEISLLTENDLHDSAQQNDSRSVLILIGVLVAIFVVAIAGFKAYNHFTAAGVVVIDDLHEKNLEGKLDSDEGYVYNGYSFVNADGLWWTSVEVKDRIIKIPLHYGPKEVEHIPVIGKLTPEFNEGEKVYVSIDPKVNYDKYYTLGLMELNTNILQGINRKIEAACSEEHQVCENRTIINCESAAGRPVVQLSVADASSVTLKGTCIDIRGNGEDLVKSVDLALYVWYKVFG